MFSLKSSSLLSFQKRSKAESGNLKSVYGIKEVASENGLRKILDSICPDKLRVGFHNLFKHLRKIKVLEAYRYWRGHLVVSGDGVEHFCSKQVHCPHCMQRQDRNGKVSYYHAMLSAAIVHPEQGEVCILDNEPIVKQDGSTKNDCERNAANRLFAHLGSLYAQQYMVFVLDALYACAPLVRQICATTRW